MQDTFLRATQLDAVAGILTVTSQTVVRNVMDEYQALNVPDVPTAFIQEPCVRNTAAAIGSAALWLAREQGEETLLLVLPADHVVCDQEAFRQAVSKAVALALDGHLVTFGIKPHRPETGYGYIEHCGPEVLRFVEKPSLEKARQYLESGGVLWNSGMFCFTARTLLHEMQRHCPDIVHALRRCVELSLARSAHVASGFSLDEESFAAVPESSIDYAVLEHSERTVVVPCEIGWHDIGSWKSLDEITEADDADQNRIQGEVVLEDSRRCTVRSEDRLVGVVGVDNLAIIDTADALLVADKDHSQQLRKLCSRLEETGWQAYREHRTSHRPWGTFTVLEALGAFKVKRIEVNPGARLSLQLHHRRSEHWVVVEGTAKVVNGEQERILHVGEAVHIPVRNKHRLENIGDGPLTVIEVQIGDYLGEDDIIRIQDDYQRN